MNTQMILEGTIRIGYYNGETSAVKIALNNLRDDLIKITGADVQLIELCAEDIIDGIDILAATKDVKRFDKWGASPEEKEILDAWEGYVIKECEGTLYINGADKRGTIYGIYEMSAYFGVSPWYFFADVPVRKKTRIVIPDNFFRADYPSVQYRGIFLNDEEELEEWAVKHTNDGTIGPELYEKIYELILRLKGNYLWPAMHVNYFQENPKSAWLANEMGIVIGTSHCDMLMRSNQNEWTPWLDKKGYKSDYNAVHAGKLNTSDDKERETIYYDYSIPGKNREVIREYWRESVEMNRDYEVCYTIGMRGVHDYGFSTKMINEDATLTGEEKLAAKIRLLETIMDDQRQLIKTECGLSSASCALQSFIPYKEVLELYNAGLTIPDDVTLIWVNDNFGHIRRYPDKRERKRAGGHGLYFHASYWGATEMSYLFFNTMPLSHTTNELRKAYANGIRKMWVLNVGALKPLEMDMETFLNYAWNAGKDTAVTCDIHGYTAQWFDSYFSGGYGEELADLYEEYTHLTNARKIEQMQPMVFTQAGYGDEAGARLCRLEKVFARANEIYTCLPDSEKDAFFQMFLFKVHSSYYVNHAFYYADRSVLSYDRGNHMAADLYTKYSRKMTQYFKKMLRYYNVHMQDGKWENILTPDSFPPPGICFYPVCRPSINRRELDVKAVMWNGNETSNEGSIAFYSGGIRKKWFEIGNTHTSAISFEIAGKPAWLDISEESGKINEEKRIYISVNDEKAYVGNEAELTIRLIEKEQEIHIKVKAQTGCKDGENRMSHLEDDGAVCIYAEDYKDCCAPVYLPPLNETGWYKVYGMGREGGSVVMAYNPTLCPLSDISITDNPYITYDFSLFSEGEFELEVTRFLTLNSVGRVRFGIGIDGFEPFILESETNDEWRGNWHDSVMNNGEKLYTKLPYLSAGKHTIKVYMIDNYVTLEKFVIYTQKRRETYYGAVLPPSITDEPRVCWETLDSIRSDLYCEDDTELLPDMVYADQEFWMYNRLYMKNDIVKQSYMERGRYDSYYEAGTAQDIAALFGKGIFVEKDGKIAIEAEYALAGDTDAYLTPDVTGKIYWRHVHALSDGGRGLAMQVSGNPYTWENAKDAPGMHYRINVSEEGEYNVWLLILYENHMSDSCYFAVDGEALPRSIQYNNGQLCNYATLHMYYWCVTGRIHFSAGEHIFSIYACDTGLQIDRIYLSRGEEHPPLDKDWTVSR